MKKDYVIYGDSAFAERLCLYILHEKKHNVVAFTNDDNYISRTSILEIPVIPFSLFLAKMKDDCELIIAYGYTNMNNLREKIYNECLNAGCRIGSYISEKALIYSNNIEEGNIILPGVVIGPNTIIGKCNYFESSVVVSHDSKIGDFNFFSTNVVMGGYSNIGNHCFLGLHSSIKNGITLADYTFLGQNCNILKNSIFGRGYIGNPARLLEKKSIELKI